MPERIRFLALQEEYREVEAEVAHRFSRVLASQSFVLGEQTTELEAAMARLVGVSHAVAVSSGSDALFLALRALDVGTGTAVLVPSYTYIASAGAVVHAGAVPVFADVDPQTLNVGPREIEAALRDQFEERDGEHFHRETGARLAAVLVVHLFGRAAAMREIRPLAARLGIHVVEDAAQAIGAGVDGIAVGAWGKIGCFSFYPTKNLGGAGDGGVLTTDDAELASRLARLRVHGADGSAMQAELGVNARMGELQAAYLNAKWPHLDAWTRQRDLVADAYAERLGALPRAALGMLPHANAPEHVHHQVAVRILGGRRERVVHALAEAGIDSRVFYPAGLHRQPCFRAYGTEQVRLPVTDAAADEILCLPIHAFLDAAAVGTVCDALARALASCEP
jgi:dTDP-4-amino-4,6-dideoxygalactose transaminase